MIKLATIMNKILCFIIDYKYKYKNKGFKGERLRISYDYLQNYPNSKEIIQQICTHENPTVIPIKYGI